jgi:hypothetical protein
MRSTLAKIWIPQLQRYCIDRAFELWYVSWDHPKRLVIQCSVTSVCCLNKSGFCRRHLVLYNVDSPGQSSTGWLVKPVAATPFFCLLRIYNCSCIHICSLNCHYKQLKPARMIFVHGTSILPERECICLRTVVPLGRGHNFNHRFIASFIPEAFVSRNTESRFWLRDPVGGAHCWQGVCSPFFLVILLQFLTYSS